MDPMFWKQLKVVLWKNWMLKKNHWMSSIVEILLPVAFMLLLIQIKSVTDIYDSPNVAYFCGNAFPWYYSTSAEESLESLSFIPLLCTQKPLTCEAENYYQLKQVVEKEYEFELDVYAQLGTLFTIYSYD